MPVDSGFVYINGEFIDSQRATVSVLDRGVLFNDGVFEDIRIIAGRPFRLEDQLIRLKQYARATGLEFPLQLKELQRVIVELVERNGIHDGGARVLVTRGPMESRSSHALDGALIDGERKSNGSSHALLPSSLIAFALEIGQFPIALPREPIDVGVYVPDRRAFPETGPVNIKSLRQTSTIVALIDVAEEGYAEALQVDASQHVLGAIYHTVFVVRSTALIVVAREVCSLGDTFRNVLLELADHMGLARVDEVPTLEDLIVSNECFLSGFATPVVPVGSVKGRQIGDGQPGPITKALMAEMDQVFRNVASAS